MHNSQNLFHNNLKELLPDKNHKDLQDSPKKHKAKFSKDNYQIQISTQHLLLESPQKKLAVNISMKTSCISALHANVNVFAQNVSFMVFYWLILGKHKDHEVKTIKKSHPIVKG